MNINLTTTAGTAHTPCDAGRRDDRGSSPGHCSNGRRATDARRWNDRIPDHLIPGLVRTRHLHVGSHRGVHHPKPGTTGISSGCAASCRRVLPARHPSCGVGQSAVVHPIVPAA